VEGDGVRACREGQQDSRLKQARFRSAWQRVSSPAQRSKAPTRSPLPHDSTVSHDPACAQHVFESKCNQVEGERLRSCLCVVWHVARIVGSQAPNKSLPTNPLITLIGAMVRGRTRRRCVDKGSFWSGELTVSTSGCPTARHQLGQAPLPTKQMQSAEKR
jgi:hypothetical protein